ncbi:MAG TPA: hypothetical protein VFS00_07390, partial [Polyangiaceae bacterium]|nr:hypothetical protein [Polyangiaceae bacterium]
MKTAASFPSFLKGALGPAGLCLALATAACGGDGNSLGPNILDGDGDGGSGPGPQAGQAGSPGPGGSGPG